MILETVKVKCNNSKGYHIINKSDFDPENHELYQDREQIEPAKRGRRARGE